MGKRLMAVKYYCPKDSKRVVGFEVCESCGVSSVLCRVKRSFVVLVDG